jgi:hypothetical protein
MNGSEIMVNFQAYSVPGAMKAGFEHYRAIPLTTQQNQKFEKTKLTMPVLAIGGVLVQ